MQAVESYSKTTKGFSSERIKELAKTLGYMGGVPEPGARALAQLIATLEVRVTDLEAQVEALIRKGNK